MLLEPSLPLITYGLSPTCYLLQENIRGLLRSHIPYRVVRACLSTGITRGALSRSSNPDSLYPCRIFPTQEVGKVPTSLFPLATGDGGSYDTWLVLPIELLLAERVFSYSHLYRFRPRFIGLMVSLLHRGSQFSGSLRVFNLAPRR